jgi:hypothetical protein
MAIARVTSHITSRRQPTTPPPVVRSSTANGSQRQHQPTTPETPTLYIQSNQRWALRQELVILD